MAPAHPWNRGITKCKAKYAPEDRERIRKERNRLHAKKTRDRRKQLMQDSEKVSNWCRGAGSSWVVLWASSGQLWRRLSRLRVGPVPMPSQRLSSSEPKPHPFPAVVWCVCRC
jgi:hypothetical protein